MSKWDDKTNNEILLEIKQMQISFEAMKLKALRDYDSLKIDCAKMDDIEQKFNEANAIIVKRLKGNI